MKHMYVFAIYICYTALLSLLILFSSKEGLECKYRIRYALNHKNICKYFDVLKHNFISTV